MTVKKGFDVSLDTYFRFLLYLNSNKWMAAAKSPR
ncbi:MAG: hypothetical protein ACI8T6_000646, partial [Candidatus Poseidoniaceae archaeon]